MSKNSSLPLSRPEARGPRSYAVSNVLRAGQMGRLLDPGRPLTYPVPCASAVAGRTATLGTRQSRLSRALGSMRPTERSRLDCG